MTIKVESETVAEILANTYIPPVPDCEVECETMKIARYVDGKLSEIACTNQRHGVHPRFAERIRSIEEKLKKLSPAYSSDAPCLTCGNTEFIPIKGTAAQQAIMASSMLGMFHGVSFQTKSLPATQGVGTVLTFLAGVTTPS